MKVLILLLAAVIPAMAAERGYNIRVATLYLSPDTSSTRMEEIERGRELTLVPGGAPPGWLHVMPTLPNEKEISGWILSKGIVLSNTPNGDRILFGEAVDSESEASRSHGRRGADRDALRLYYAVYDLFPNSPLAGEALYRAADIRWQIDREDIFGHPAGKQADPFLHREIDKSLMNQVIKKFPGTKWAELAAYDLLDNKMCAEWQGLPKCPEKESEVYEKYAVEHPQSPATPEALYKAAYRQAALIELYRTENQEGKAAGAKQKALELARRLASAYPQNDWGARGQRLAFLVEQGVNVYGSGVE